MSPPAENFFPLRWLASAGRRRAFLFSLMKRDKNQGLELMSDKIVKAFRAAAQAPDEGSGNMRCVGLKDCDRSFKRFLLPSFPRPDSMVDIAGCHLEGSEESLCFCLRPSVNIEPFLLRHSMNGGLKRSSSSACFWMLLQ